MNSSFFYSLLKKQFPFNPTIKQDLFFQQIAEFCTNIDNNEIYVLKGYAGTGKTTVIAQMIKMLVMKGRSVLLTSFTHSAVDNVLLKLNEIGIEFIRLGAVEKMHPTIKDVVLKKKKNQPKK